MSKLRQQLRSARITRGALAVLVTQVVVSIGVLMVPETQQRQLLPWIEATPHRVFDQGRVWTLFTSPLLERDFLWLIMSALMLWLFVPTLERFWGTARFLRFVALTSVAATLGGCLVGLATGREVPIVGFGPFVAASVVAFGIVYARQPVMFSFYIQMTGRQLMYGYLGFIALFVLLQSLWEQGGAVAAAVAMAVVLTSKNLSPGLRWRKWRIQRARAKLSVIDGGAPRPTKKKADERFLN